MKQYLKNLLLKLIPSRRREKLAKVFMNSLGFGQTNLEIEAKNVSHFANKSTLNNFTILDVGASVGNYTKYLVSLTKAKIVCFEPSPKAFKNLEKNLVNETKNLNSKVKLFNIGLIANSHGSTGKKREIKKYIYSDVRGSDLGSLFIGVTTKQKEKASFIEVNQLVKYIDCPIVAIKLDIEGYEFILIKSLGKIFSNPNFICLQFEFGVNSMDSGTNFKDIYDFLISKNFKIKRISPYGLIDVEDYTYHLEINWPTNYIAIKKDYLD